MMFLTQISEPVRSRERSGRNESNSSCDRSRFRATSPCQNRAVSRRACRETPHQTGKAGVPRNKPTAFPAVAIVSNCTNHIVHERQTASRLAQRNLPLIRLLDGCSLFRQLIWRGAAAISDELGVSQGRLKLDDDLHSN